MLSSFETKRIFLHLALISFLCFFTGCTEEQPYKNADYMVAMEGDNSLDKYSYTSRGIIEPPEAKNAIDGGASSVFMAKTGGYYYKKVVHKDYREDYDTMTFSEMTSDKILKWPHTDGRKSRWAAGSVVDSDDFVFFCMSEDDPITYEIDRLDKSGQLIETVITNLGGLNEIMIPDGLIMDKEGITHMAYRNHISDSVSYYLVNPDGEIIHEETFEHCFLSGMLELPNGDVAIAISPLEGNYFSEYQICVYDSSLDNMKMLISWDYVEYSKKLLESNPKASQVVGVNAYNMFVDGRILASTSDGIYLVDQEKMENILLYEWSNHGISPSQVYCIKADEAQNIYLMYGDEEGINYLVLSPTKEEKPVKKILFAVSEVNKRKYTNAVAKFNKKHPLYIISMREYQYSEKDRLIAKITSGDGAVLVDTSLVGFLQMGDLWESLDDCFDDSESAAFNESALSLGVIEDKLCGVVTDFYIDTIFASENINSMDYVSFLRELGTYNGDKALFDFCGKEGIEEFVLGYLCRTAEDCYYFTDGLFDGDKFREAVEYAEKYVPKENRDNYYSKGDSVALFNESYIDNVAQIELNRLKFGGNIEYVGLPGDNGGNHYLVGSQPITVRTNATAEEKAIAKEFIKTLMSYETQIAMSKQYEYGLSTREDVLDEQIADMKDYLYEELMASGINADTVIKEIDTEEAAVELKNIINSAKVTSEKFWEYRRIISEELEAYLYDSQSMDEMLDHLRSRVNIYMEEKK